MTVPFRKRLRLVCLLALCAAGLSLLLSCQHARGGAVGSRKLIILGIDGLDPDLLTKFMAEGKMPNFARLAEQGAGIGAAAAESYRLVVLDADPAEAEESSEVQEALAAEESEPGSTGQAG